MTLSVQAKRLVQRVLAKGGMELSWGGQSRGSRRAALLRARDVDLVIDVGANTGQFGREVRRFGYDGDLLSIEPLSAAYAALQAEAAADARWSTIRSCVGAQEGDVVMNVSANSVSSSVLPMLARSSDAAPGARYVSSETVPMDTLDALAGKVIAQAAAPYLKIDTQGFEAQVLAGAADSLERLVAVELELSLVELYEGQQLMPDVLSDMASKGFRLAAVSEEFNDSKTGESLQINGTFVR